MDNDLSNICNNPEFERFKNKKILITGGAGFIGSWLCEVFLKLDARVYCIDDYSTSKPTNISHLLNHKNFSFKKIDINKPLEENIQYDMILHFASRPSPEDYVKHPVETLLVNTRGTFNLLDLSKKQGAVFLFASTSEIYGDSHIIPTPESYWGNVNPIGIRSCYDEGKRVSEALVMAYYREYDMDVKIVRIFNSYGPRIRADGIYGRVVPRFISQALEGRCITVHGDGTQTRSFCYITDTIRGILLTLSNAEITGKPVNIGHTNEISILELAKKIQKKFNNEIEIKFIDKFDDDPKRRCPDISLAKQFLKWEPEVDLDHGLDKTILWIKSKT